MTSIRTILYLGLAFAMAASCKKDDTGSGTKSPPGTTATAAETETAPPDETPGTKERTVEQQVAERFKTCWQAFNNKDEAAMRDCYDENAEFVAMDYTPPMKGEGVDAAVAMVKDFWQAFPDIESEPQLVLVKGSNVAAIIHTEGTNSGKFGDMPPTNKKLSIFEAQLLSVTPDLKAGESRHWIDQSVMASQLGMRESETAPDAETPWEEQIWVTAENSEVEKTNLELAKAMRESLMNGDQEAYMKHVAEDVSSRYVGDREPMNGLASYRKSVEEWTTMADHRFDMVDMWAAGDWVVSVNEVTSKLKQNMPGTKNTKGKEVNTTILEFLQFDKGKLKSHWIFENSMAYPVQLGLIEMPMSKPKKTTKSTR